MLPMLFLYLIDAITSCSISASASLPRCHAKDGERGVSHHDGTHRETPTHSLSPWSYSTQHCPLSLSFSHPHTPSFLLSLPIDLVLMFKFTRITAPKNLNEMLVKLSLTSHQSTTGERLGRQLARNWEQIDGKRERNNKNEMSCLSLVIFTPPPTTSGFTHTHSAKEQRVLIYSLIFTAVWSFTVLERIKCCVCVNDFISVCLTVECSSFRI